MKQLYDDLWQTQVENPFAGLNTHAYFLKCKEGNVLFYNTSHEDDIQEIIVRRQHALEELSEDADESLDDFRNKGR